MKYGSTHHMWSSRCEYQNPENAAYGGCDETERFSRTEDGYVLGSSNRSRCCDHLGALVCKQDQYDADVIVGAVDNAHDNPANLVNHFRLQTAPAYHGNAADNPGHDASPIEQSNLG